MPVVSVVLAGLMMQSRGAIRLGMRIACRRTPTAIVFRGYCRYTMVVLWGIVVPHIAHASFCDTVESWRQRTRARMRHNDRSVFNHGEKSDESQFYQNMTI